MRNSTLNRSMLSSENMSLLAELKAQNEEQQNLQINHDNNNNNNGSSYQHKTKQDELDFLWQNFRVGSKEEKSPGVYLLTGFIAGALSMFLMTTMFSFSTSQKDLYSFENGRKIVKKEHGSFLAGNEQEKIEKVKPAENEESAEIEPIAPPPVINEKYLVKAGDSLEAISLKYYGAASPANTAKIQKANNLASPHAIFIGQELNIPLD